MRISERGVIGAIPSKTNAPPSVPHSYGIRAFARTTIENDVDQAPRSARGNHIFRQYVPHFVMIFVSTLSVNTYRYTSEYTPHYISGIIWHGRKILKTRHPERAILRIRVSPNRIRHPGSTTPPGRCWFESFHPPNHLGRFVPPFGLAKTAPSIRADNSLNSGHLSWCPFLLGQDNG